jgi:hypothetical protein
MAPVWDSDPLQIRLFLDHAIDPFVRQKITDGAADDQRWDRL